MERFIIKHYRSLLERATDENERQIILKLLAEEEGSAATGRRVPEPPAARAS